MSKNDKSDLKNIYDKILCDNVTDLNDKKINSDSSAQNKFKSFLGKIINFLNKEYLSVSLILTGLLMFCFGFFPVMKIISNQFLESLNVSVNFFQIAGWLFSSTKLNAENIFLSLFALFYILTSIGMIVIGILFLCKVIKSRLFLITSLLYLLLFIVIFSFLITFVIWLGIAKDANLYITGVNVIYYNFSTCSFYTLVYFHLSLVLFSYSLLYTYHNKKDFFK